MRNRYCLFGLLILHVDPHTNRSLDCKFQKGKRKFERNREHKKEIGRWYELHNSKTENNRWILEQKKNWRMIAFVQLHENEYTGFFLVFQCRGQRGYIKYHHHTQIK
jgi:hypothetical protein